MRTLQQQLADEKFNIFLFVGSVKEGEEGKKRLRFFLRRETNLGISEEIIRIILFLLEMFYSEGLDLIWRLLGGPIFSTIGFVSFDDTGLYFDTYFWIQSKAI